MRNLKDVINPNGLWDSESKTFIPRKACVEKCVGCEKQLIDENKPLPVCEAYVNPVLKWKFHTSEVVTKKIKGQDIDFVLHYKPCPLATHAKHTLSNEELRKINPLKASKRSRR